MNPNLFDEFMFKADCLIFKIHPTVWFDKFVTPARTEWFSFFYLLIFIYPLLIGGSLYLKGRKRDFRVFLQGFVLSGYFAYMGYLIFPVIGPKYYFPEFYTHSLTSGVEKEKSASPALFKKTSFTEIADTVSYDRAITDKHSRNCFPSLHSAWAFFLLLFTFRRMKSFFWFLLLPLIYLLIATLYLRFHYVADILAGLFLALFSYWFFPKINKLWEKHGGQTLTDNSMELFFSFKIVNYPWLNKIKNFFWNNRIYIIFILIVAPVYLTLLPDGITNKHRGADGAELIAAAMSGGIPHPTGYPLYMMIVKSVCSLPFIQEPINCAHFLSALFGIIACLFLIAASKKVLSEWLLKKENFYAEISALTAGLLLAFSRNFWNQAVIAEVYSLYILFIGTLIYLQVLFFFEKDNKRQKRLLYLFSFILGLAFCHHLSIIYLLPSFLFLIFIKSYGLLKKSLKTVFLALLSFLSGLLPLAYLPMAAALQPVFNWGNPNSLTSFLWVLSGKQYQFRLRGDIKEIFLRFWEKFQPAVDFSPMVIIISLTGLTLGFYWSRIKKENSSILWYLVFLLLLTIGNIIGVSVYDISDLYNYYLPTEFVLAALSATGIYLIFYSLKTSHIPEKAIRFSSIVLLTFLPLSQFVSHLEKADLAGTHTEAIKAREILKKAPYNALIIGNGDSVIFPLWYYYFVHKDRNDLDILDISLAAQDWYLTNTSHFTPEFSVPTEINVSDKERNSPESVLKAFVSKYYGKRPLVMLRKYDYLKGYCIDKKRLLEKCER